MGISWSRCLDPPITSPRSPDLPAPHRPPKIQLNKDVANCHKLPAYNFDRRILSVEEITSSLHLSIANVFRVNPKARVVLTVSPVRHWRDGSVENARSKAHLLAGAHGAIERLREAGLGRAGVGGPGHCGYFPSYEIVNDDLRSVGVQVSSFWCRCFGFIVQMTTH